MAKQIVSGFPSPPIPEDKAIRGPVELYPSNAEDKPRVFTKALLKTILIEGFTHAPKRKRKKRKT